MLGKRTSPFIVLVFLVLGLGIGAARGGTGSSVQGGSYLLAGLKSSYRFVRQGNDLFLDRITLLGSSPVEFAFKHRDLFDVTLREAGGATRHLIPSNAVDLRVTMTSAGGIAYLFASWSFPLQDPYTVTMTVRLPLADTLALWDLTAVSGAPVVTSLYEVEYPILSMLPLGDPTDDYFTFPYQVGAIAMDPHHLRTSGGIEFLYGGGIPTVPPITYNMQWASFGDRGVGAALFLGTLDTSLEYKRYRFAGETDATRYSFVHYPSDSLRAGNDPWRVPYAVAVGPVAGDAFDAGRRYRSWAASQIWLSQKLRDHLTPAMRDAQIFSVYNTSGRPGGSLTPAEWDSMAAGLAQWKSFLGVDRTCGMWYGLNTFPDPNETFPFVGFPASARGMIDSLHAKGDHLARYWRLDNLPSSSAYYPAMEPNAVHLEDGGVFLNGEGFAVLNPIVSASRQFQLVPIGAQLDDVATGLYFDVFPIAYLDYSDRPEHAPGGGNYFLAGDWLQAAEVRGAYGSNGTYFQGTEYGQEWLAGVTDFHFANFHGINTGGYIEDFYVDPETGLGGLLHDYTIGLPTSAIDVVQDDSPTFLGGYTWGLWLHLGMMPTVNGELDHPFPPAESSASSIPFFGFVKSLIRTYVRFEDFLKYGERRRDLGAAEIDGVGSVPPSAVYPDRVFARVYHPDFYPELPLVLGSRWLDGTGQALLLLVNWCDGTHCSGTPAHNLNVSLTDLGIPGTADVYESIDGAAEQYVGAYTGTLQYQAQLDPWSVHALRIVPR